MSQTPRVAVAVIGWNHAKFLRQTVAALRTVQYPAARWHFFLIDNASSDDTVYLATHELLDLEVGTIRHSPLSASLHALQENIGFAGGANYAIAAARAAHCDYLYLLNPDTEVTPAFLHEIVAVMEADATIGVAQSLLVLADEPAVMNSWGNEVHYLGFSFCGGHRVPLARARKRLTVHDIPSASGAGMMLRLSALDAVGTFHEQLFAYHEDVDISWRLRLGGYRVVLAPRSVVRHRYEFSRSIKKYYFMERNRMLVHLKNLKIKTLVLLAPAAIAMELGLWLFSFRGGWWREKARAYSYLLNSKHLAGFLSARRAVQNIRTVNDRSIVEFFSATLRYQDMRNVVWDYVANPLFALYWYLVRWIIRW